MRCHFSACRLSGVRPRYKPAGFENMTSRWVATTEGTTPDGYVTAEYIEFTGLPA